MDDPRNTMAGRTCHQCGANADVGRIFCANCGATIQIPIVLAPSGSEDGDLPPKNMSSMKRTALMAISGLAAVAGVLFWLCPLRTGTQILLFVSSIAVLLLCHVLLTELDETYVAK